MFTVIYSFNVKPDSVLEFKKAWRELTLLIQKHEGSLGSRLHKNSENTYIAYAQWPDKQVWAESGGNMPDSNIEFRRIMKDSCTKIKILFELDVIDDLLVNKGNNPPFK